MTKASSNPFTGSWQGTWQGRQNIGSWTLHILSDGSITGTADTKGNGITGTLTGHIENTSELSYRYSYRSERTGKGTVSFNDTNELLVQWRDFDDTFLYDDGESVMKRLG